MKVFLVTRPRVPFVVCISVFPCLVVVLVVSLLPCWLARSCEEVHQGEASLHLYCFLWGQLLREADSDAYCPGVEVEPPGLWRVYCAVVVLPLWVVVVLAEFVLHVDDVVEVVAVLLLLVRLLYEEADLVWDHHSWSSSPVSVPGSSVSLYLTSPVSGSITFSMIPASVHNSIIEVTHCSHLHSDVWIAVIGSQCSVSSPDVIAWKAMSSGVAGLLRTMPSSVSTSTSKANASASIATPK